MAVPDIGVELQIGSLMTNVLDDVHHPAGISYSWGRRAEGSRTDPAAASLVLLNADGKYSGRNPLSPNFGQLGRNAPLRLTHGGANVALVVPPDSIGRATTPDVAALDIVGDIDVRADLTPVQWGGTTTSDGGWEVMGKWGAVGQQSWYLRMQDSGRIAFGWSTNGVTGIVTGSDAEVPFAPGQRGAIRVALDVSNGLGGYTVAYYTAPTIAGPWTQLGNPDVITTGGATSIFNSTAALQVGDVGSLDLTSIAREYHAVEIRNGIAGSVVANPDFTIQTSGATSFTDAAGRSWSAATGLITSRRTRAVLEAADMTPRWSNAVDVTTPITGAGILRRLGRGAKPLASTLRRSLPTIGSGPVAYWPMEDGSDSTRAASAVVGVQPLRVADFDFAADNSCAGAASLPTVGAAATMHAAIPTYTSLTTGYTVAMMYSLDALPASKSFLLSIQTTGTSRGVVVSFTSTQIVCEVYGAGGTLLTTQSFTPAAAVGAGRWWRLELTAQWDGVDTDFTCGVFTDDGVRDVMAFSVAGTPGLVTDIDTAFGPLLEGMAIGHLVVFSDSTSTEWFNADIGYQGEEAGARLLRLCTEEGIPVSIADGQGVHTLLGPQRPAKLLDLFDEIEAADGGMLVEDRNRLGLMFRTRASLYSQSPRVTIPYGQLVAPLEHTDDDRYTRNDRTAQRVQGSSARAVLTSGALSTAAPPNGVGVYDDSTTVNVATDDQLPDIASWLLHRGTWDEARYPKVRILLHKYPSLVPAVSALQPGDVIRITDLPAWLPPGPVDLMVEGAEEQFRTFEWTITLSCSPAGPWNVGILGSTALGRLATAGSTLASGATSTATSLSVASTGRVWSPLPADWPFNILIGGEAMTVTAVSGSTSPQTFTVTRSVNGIVKAHSAAAPVSLATPLTLAL